MPIFQCTLFCEAAGDCAGWSHTFYRDEPGYDQAMAKLSELRNEYLDTQSGGVSVKAQRVSDVDKSGDAQEVYLEIATGNVADAHLTGPDEGVLVRFNTGNGYSASMLLKGMVDDWAKRTNKGRYVLSVAGHDAWYAFTQKIIEQDWMLRINLKPPQKQSRPVLDVTVDKSKGIYTVRTQPNTLQTGDKVFICGAEKKLWPAIRGEQTVKVISNTEFEITSRIPCGVPAYGGALTWYAREIQYRQVVSAVIQRVGSRLSGRPFGLLAGRNSLPAPRCQ